MLGCLSACLSVRVWICLKDVHDTARARALDITVTGIALLFSAGWVMLQRPSPFYALLSGSGFGALGTGIIAVSLKWVRGLAPIDAADGALLQAHSVERICEIPEEKRPQPRVTPPLSRRRRN